MRFNVLNRVCVLFHLVLTVSSFVLFSSQLYGENVIVLDENTFSQREPVYPSFSRQQIQQEGPDIEALLAKEKQGLVQWGEIAPNLIPFYSELDSWYRFVVQNSTESTLELVLDFPVSPLNKLAVFYVRNDQLDQSFNTGVWQPQSERPISYSLFATRLDLAPKEKVAVYISTANTPRRTMSSMRLFVEEDFYAFQAKNEALFGTHIGLAASVVLFNFILLVLIKEIRYVWFILYALGQMLIISATAGKSTAFWLDHAPSLVPYEILLYSTLATVGIVLFSNTILNLKEKAPVGFWLTIASACGNVFLLAYSLLSDEAVFRFIYLAPFAGIILLVIFFNGLRQSLRGDAAIRLFTLGMTIPLATVAYVSYSSLLQDVVLNMAYSLSLLLLCVANLLRIGQLKRKEELALLSSQAKTSFITQLSHEIRNPMNGILGMSQILMSSDLGEENKKNVSIIHQSASSLLSILNDVLDYSKIVANKMQLERIPFELKSLIMSASNIYKAQCESQGLKLNVRVSEELPSHFYGDPNRITQILTNLMSNAVKFSEQGGIYVDVSYRDKGRHELCFSVRDEGAGIGEEQFDSLFKDYEQLSPSIARQFGGTGLGLPICKRLAELMHGCIEVNSTKGQGSCFSLVIPLDVADKLTSGLPKNEENECLVRPLHILFAEDNSVNSQVLVAFLNKFGCSFKATHNGREAVDAYLSSLADGEQKYDGILMDCEMPILGGIEAVEEIRAREVALDVEKAVPIFALTGHVMPEYTERCFVAGMNKVLTKPIESGKLVRALNSLAR